MSDADAVEEKKATKKEPAEKRAATEKKAPPRPRAKSDEDTREARPRRNQRSNNNNRNKGGRGGNGGRHRNYKQDANMQDDSLPPVVGASEPVDLSDVELTEDEKAALSSKGLKTKKIEEVLQLDHHQLLYPLRLLRHQTGQYRL